MMPGWWFSRCFPRQLRQCAAVIVTLGSLVGAVQADGAEPLAPGQVQRQYVAVTLDPEQHRLAAESTIVFAPGTRTASLRLSESAKIDDVEVAGRKTAFSFNGGILSVEMPSSREAVLVTVSYRAVFNDPVSQRPAAGEDPSYGVSGAITRDGTFLGEGAYWYPVPPQVPLQRSTSISAPAGTEAVTYGRRVARETVDTVTRSVWEEARPVGALSLCAGPYRIEERRVNGVDIYSYLYPDNASLSARYLDAAAKYVTFYSDLFGPYPFEKFAVVENFFPTGYGFPSFTLLGGSVIRLPFIVDTSFPHEIAHSWWGNGIEPDLREGNWSEGLVTYLADYLLKERRSPVEAREYRRQLLIDYASLVTPANDFPLRQFASRTDPASRAIGYGKAAMLFHMVRLKIGEDAFFRALRQVSRDHMYGTASWSDFVRAFSVSSGRDLAPFMQQFLDRTGGPRLHFGGVSGGGGAQGRTVSGSIVQKEPFYRLDVPLRLESRGNPRNAQVTVAGERSTFVIEADAPAIRLLLDPDADVFRILSPEEIPATVNSIKGSTTLVGVITDDCRANEETFKFLLGSLSQETAPVVRESLLDPKQTAGHDLIFCGLPKNAALRPPLPADIHLSPNTVSVQGETVPAPDALLVTVMHRPGAPGRVSALFLPLSQGAAAQYAGKITHYGKYGYLLFTGGANRAKGTPAATDRGAVVDFQR